MTASINQLIDYKGVCRRAPATPDLLIKGLAKNVQSFILYVILFVVGSGETLVAAVALNSLSSCIVIPSWQLKSLLATVLKHLDSYTIDLSWQLKSLPATVLKYLDSWKYM